MGQLTQTTTELQAIVDNSDAANVGKTSLTDGSDTTAVAFKKSGFYSLQGSSSNAPSTDRAVLISAIRDTAATGEIRYGQIAITESNGLWWNRDDGGSLGTWYAAVSTTGTQTLTNKTLTSPVLTTPQINDSAADHQYIFAGSNLVADRTITLPLLTGDDTFVFEAHTQTLTNKTLTSPVFNTGVSGTAVLDADDFTGASATTLATSESIKAYVDAQVGTVDTLAEVLVNGNATDGTNVVVTAGDVITTDTISETTAAAGVTIDSVLLKDDGVNATNLEVTNIKANDGTAAGSIADSTGVMTIASSVLTTADINAGTIDGTVIGGTTPAAITGTAITATGIMTATGTSVFASLDISGDVDIDGTTNLDVVDIDGAVDMATTLTVAGNVDFNGDLDVDGTTNLDVVDIDGAVNMATTALVTGVLTTTAATVFNGGFASNADSTLGTDKKVQFRDSAIYINSSADGQLDIVADTEIQIAATTIDIDGAINASGEIIAASLDISGDIDVDGVTNLDVVDIDGAVDFGSTTAHAGNATFADNAKAIFGAGSDLQIYHDASDSIINDNGTGSLKLQQGGSTKLEVTATGIDVTGTVTADGLTSSDKVTMLAGTATTIAEMTIQSNASAAGGYQRATLNLLDKTGLTGWAIKNLGDGSDSLDVNSVVAGVSTKHMRTDNNGDISFYEDTGTTPKFFWDASAESLGIGTSTDLTGSRVHIAQSVAGANKGITLSADGTSTNGYADFSISPTDTLTIQMADDTTYRNIALNPLGGNVGIGTSSPDAIIETSASATGNTVGALLTNTNGSGTADSVSLNFGLGRSVDGYIRSVEAIKLLKEQQWTGTASTVDAALVFSTVSNEATSEAMRIDASGHIHTGYTSNFGGDHVNVLASDGGGISIAQNNAGTATSGTILGSLSFQSYLNGQTLGEADARISAIAAENQSGSAAGTDLAFYTKPNGTGPGSAPSERMRIDASGNLMLGTTTASAKLFVVKGESGNSFGARNTSASNIGAVGFFGADRNTTNGTFHYIDCYNYGSSTYRFRVADSGNVTNTNNSYGALSDVKLKENIIDSGSQWDDIKALRVRKYSLKSDSLDAPNKLGVIAQELESVGMAGLVSESEDRDEEGNNLGTVTKTVAYSVLYMKAVKALQEAMERIETLEAKVAAIES
jgi:hypothetical protein